MFNYCDKVMGFFFFFFLINKGSQTSSSIRLFPWACAISRSHTRWVIIGRNPMEVAPRCWQEVLNPGSHEYHDASGTTKLTP